MKKVISLMLIVMLLLSVAVFSTGCIDTSSTVTNQGTDDATADNLGEYQIDIKSCRLAKDYAGKDVAIITYGFTNNSDDPSAFYVTFDCGVYQGGVGLNEAYILDDSANYNSDNQTKEIKKGASIDVEVAYELNDTTTDLEVEVKEFFSFNDDTITKTFKIK